MEGGKIDLQQTDHTESIRRTKAIAGKEAHGVLSEFPAAHGVCYVISTGV